MGFAVFAARLRNEGNHFTIWGHNGEEKDALSSFRVKMTIGEKLQLIFFIFAILLIFWHFFNLSINKIN